MEKIKIKGPYIKLDSLMKFAGLVDTGGMAKFVILDGYVLVNGHVCKKRGTKLSLGDTVEFQGKKIEIVLL